MKKFFQKIKRGHFIFLIIGLFWLLIGLTLYFKQSIQIDNYIYSLALNEARSNFNKDVLYRRWVALEGGVYVFESDYTPSNPYLKVPNRDIFTKEGQKLTLVNPAYMTRLVHELELKGNGVKGHITSLNPIRPANIPDSWETSALRSFEKGESEFHKISDKDSGIYFRFMAPLVTEKPCLKCHLQQGYKIGDVRGGISISVPFTKYLTISKSQKTDTFVFLLIISTIGLIGLFVSFKVINNYKNELEQEKEKIKESEKLTRLIIENSPVGIFFYDNLGNIILCNNEFTKILEIPKESVIGANISMLPNQKIVKCIEKTLAGEKVYFEDYYNSVKSEKTLFVRAFFTSVFSDDKKLIGGIIILEDFTERKNLEMKIKDYIEELERINEDLNSSKLLIESNLSEKNILIDELSRAKEELERINSEKDKFFSIIAHDLRSPFQGFLGFTELLYTNLYNFSIAELSSSLNKMYQNAKNLFQLLKNLLEWSKMQRGNYIFEPKEINLNNLVEQNINSLKNSAEAKNISVLNKTNSEYIVKVDENMINSVLMNLISNAVKFSNKNGKIMISTEFIDNSFIEISVVDDGIGMSAGFIKKLFKIHEKTGRKGTAGEDSSGLGLLLCKEFVEKHKGNIWAESQEGIGSKFCFTLPLYSGSYSF